MYRTPKYKLLANTFFKDMYGEDFVLTDEQAKIFRAVYEPSIKRVAIKAVTQYGKSDVTSMALVQAMVDRVEKIVIVAPSDKQANIIMGDVIDHFFDHPMLKKMLEYMGSLEKLKQERSKQRLTTKNGSEIFKLTAEARNIKQNAKTLMGFGATMVVIDESALIPDAMYTKILRMVGGHKVGKIVQLGNPWEDNHFGRAFKSDRYHKISIDWRQALKEKRITQEFLDEVKDEATPLEWLVLYESAFPKHGAEDQLIPDHWIDLAMTQEDVGGEKRQAGLDVARYGNDSTCYMFRVGGTVKRSEITNKMDNMEVVGWVRPFIEEDLPEQTCVDIVGLGAGVGDRLTELVDDPNADIDTEIMDINVGEAPVETGGSEKFLNLRAQIYWHLRSLFKPDKATGKSKIKIPNDPELKKDLKEIRYKITSEKKIKIEAKDDMKQRLGRSPDRADTLALTFMDVEGSQPELLIMG